MRTFTCFFQRLAVVLALLLVTTLGFRLSTVRRNFPIIGAAATTTTTTLTALRSTPTAQMSFPDDLIESLDLEPLMRGIAEHTGTRRGRQAVLALAKQDVNQRALEMARGRSMPSRRRRVTELQRDGSTKRHSELIRIAATMEEAQNEYNLVEQALLALNTDKLDTEDIDDLTYPPLYGLNSSPDDTATTAETDDDDWMWLPSDQLTLEHVLQAEQVVITLLEVKEWAQLNSVSIWLPGLSAIGRHISHLELLPVLKKIGNAVEIFRVRTATDLHGKSTFTFRLKEEKYPDLQKLRLKEQNLLEKIDRQMKMVIRKTKGSPEYVDYEGRKVILVPKSTVSPDIGLIRGTLDGRNYVEPQSIVEWGDELVATRHKLECTEATIKEELIQTILRSQSIIDASLQVMARLDVIFARAAFGKRMQGSIPKISASGSISVEQFVHPVLALDDFDSVVSTDLHLADNRHPEKLNRALIISGPNGGGKSMAMKSFGVASLLAKIAVPIPHRSGSSPQVDFFPHVLVELGDQQNVIEGESTFMAKLNACSNLILRIQEVGDKAKFLVLLDELGTGTDPTAGGAIGQAIVEKLLEYNACRIVATTHSPRLKALSFHCDDLECATVLLKRGISGEYKLPSYQLQYGLIGDSYALGAAARATPPLPNDLIVRAATLITEDRSNGEEGSGESLQALSSSLEKQVNEAEQALAQAEQVRDEASDCRDALLSMARSYENYFTGIEEQLESMVQRLKEDKNHELEVVGETLLTLRLVKKKVKTDSERLREQGLRPLSGFHQFVIGETVVVVAKGPWEGISARVTGVQGNDAALVVPESNWDNPFFVPEDQSSDKEKSLVFQRHELAVWDYDSVWDDAPSDTRMFTSSIRESKQRLGNLLSSVGTLKNGGQKTSQTRNVSLFKSSRERKTAASIAKKVKKKKRK